MATQDIPRDQWVSYFDDMSKEYLGRKATVESFQDNAGAQIVAHELTFEGISADLKDKEDNISIIVSQSDDNHLTHIVSQPTTVTVDTDDSGTGAVVKINSASDGMVHVHLT